MTAHHDKIRKLLALATHTATPDSEALNAFRAAFALAAKHDLEPFAPGLRSIRQVVVPWPPQGPAWDDPIVPYPTAAAASVRQKARERRQQARREAKDRGRGDQRDAAHPNIYVGMCMTCGKTVPPLKGFAIMHDVSWRVICSKAHAPAVR